MSRTDITPTALVADASTAQVKTTIDAALVTAGVRVKAPRAGERLILVITNTHATLDLTVTVKAGADIFSATSGPAWQQGQGNLVVTPLHTNSPPLYVGPFTSARFEQADGYIYLDLQTALVGTLECYTYPQGF